MKKIIQWLILANLILLPVTIFTIATAPDCTGDHGRLPGEGQIMCNANEKPIVLPSADDVETRINQYRVNKDLTALASSDKLDQAAQARAEGMCAENDWSHDRAWEVLDQHYVYEHAGENLYHAPLQHDQAADAVVTWSLSPTHLENMVGDYQEIGVAVKSCSGFQGKGTAVIITNYFGVPQ